MRVIAIVNEKGGVGKTTTAINLGAGLDKLGKKVLLIDLDPQENLTNSLGLQGFTGRKNMYHLIKGDAEFQDIILERETIHIAPASAKLLDLQDKLGYIKKYDIVKNQLRNLEHYDYVIIDCPANLGVLAINGLIAADDIYVPLQSEFLALHGMAKLNKTIQQLKDDYGQSVEISGIIATRYDKRRKLNNEVIRNIKEFFGDKLFRSLIRENIALAEAPSFGKTIFEYRKACHGARDYMDLSKEVIERDNAKETVVHSPKKISMKNFVEGLK